MVAINNNAVDDVPVLDGNDSFIGGQVSATNPERVPQNAYADSQNMDLDDQGRLVTRRGAKSLVGNILTGAWEGVSSNWDAITSLFGTSLSSTAIDSAVFFDNGTTEYIILAQGGALLSGTESAAFSSISGSSYSGSNVWFAILANRVYYCDGINALKYVDSSVANQTITAGKVTSITITEPGVGYNSVPAITFTHNGGSSGAATAVLGYGGRVISATVTTAGSGYSATTPPTIAFAAAPAGGTTALGRVNISQVPSKPKFLIAHNSRLFCASADTAIPADTLYVSDILDGESWDLVGGSKRIGGDGDAITGIFSWYGNNVLVFKERSIWVVDADPTLDVADWQVSPINNRVGCISHRSIQPVGKDVMFLARDGVRRLSQLNAGAQTEVGLAISSDISDELSVINQGYLDRICSAFYRNRYFLSFPSGSATSPNVTMVYNALTGKWMGPWVGWQPRAYVITAFSGKVRLSFADAQGKFWTWDDYTSPSDETSAEYRDDTTDYESFVITRAYNHGDPVSDKQGHMVVVQTENKLPDSAVTLYLSYDKDNSGTFTSLDSSVSIPASTNRSRKTWSLLGKGRYGCIQFKLGTTRYKAVLHGLAVTAFPDTPKPENN